MNYSDLSTEQQMIAETKKYVNNKALDVQSDWNESDSSAGDYIKNKPTLGTAAVLDVASSGDASSSQVVKGNDSRLTDSRDAADVYSWAKAPTKPTYTASEVGAYTKTESDNKYVAKETGKGLSTNDYTTADKNKLAGIEAEANKTVVDSFMSDSSTNPLQNKVITKELEGAKTTTGNPLTIEDAAPVNAVNLSMDLEPIQDLHGYDNPWVGGAGKNKLPMTVDGIKAANTSGTWSGNAYTVNGVTFTILTDSDGNVTGIKVNGTASATSFFVLNTNLSFTVQTILNGNTLPNASESNCLRFIDSGGTSYDDLGNGVTIPSNFTGQVQFRINRGYTANNVICYPMIRLSTETDSSFAPYSNICPISGRSEVAIDRVGKNLINNTATTTTTGGVTYTVNQDKTISCSNTSTGTSNITIISNATLKAGNYILTGCPNGGGMETMRLHAYRTNGGYLGFDIGSGAEFTLENDINDLNVEIRIGSGVNTNGKIFKPMIRLSTDTDSTYEPYAGKTYTIQLGQTVYGCTLDVVRGELYVDRRNDTFSWGNGANTTQLTDVTRKYFSYSSLEKKPTGTVSGVVNICDVCKEYVSFTENTPHFYIDTSAESFVVFLPNNTSNDFTFNMCYKLATPYTIQLTPQQIKLLENTNTLYTDYEGDTITIEYQPDNAIGEAVRVVEESYDAELEYLKPTGSISSGDTKAVTGGAVYSYHNTTPLNPKANLYIEKSGNVINIEARDVDGSAFTTYPGAGGYTLPTGYRPKRMLIVCVYVYTTYDNKNHHGIIKIRDDGTMDGYFIDFSGNEHKIYDSSYSSSVSFNTSYIV